LRRGLALDRARELERVAFAAQFHCLVTRFETHRAEVGVERQVAVAAGTAAGRATRRELSTLSGTILREKPDDPAAELCGARALLRSFAEVLSARLVVELALERPVEVDGCLARADVF
jgi:hypothetical protein